MARHRQEEMLLNNLRELPPDEPAAAALAPGRGGGHGVRLVVCLLDAGRVLMLCGWGTIVAAISSTRPPHDDDAANAATHAFLGLLLWLAGVSLVTFTPAARRRRRFPRAVAWRGAAAAVTSLVMGCFFPPWN